MANSAIFNKVHKNMQIWLQIQKKTQLNAASSKLNLVKAYAVVVYLVLCLLSMSSCRKFKIICGQKLCSGCISGLLSTEHAQLNVLSSKLSQ
jgi:hypothetical protein